MLKVGNVVCRVMQNTIFVFAHTHAHISDMTSDIMLTLVVLTFVIDILINNYYSRSTLLCMILT